VDCHAQLTTATWVTIADGSFAFQRTEVEKERERETDGYTRSQGQRGDTEKYIGKVEQQIAELVC